VFGWRWLVELSLRSRQILDRRLLRRSGVKAAERKLKRIVDKSRKMERLLKDSFSMDSGGRGRRKEKQKIRGRLGKKKDTTTIPRQWRQKACWVF